MMRYTREFGIFALTENGDVAAGHLLMKTSTETAAGRLDLRGVNAPSLAGSWVVYVVTQGKSEGVYVVLCRPERSFGRLLSFAS
jgi:hypothetical protein